MNSPNSFATAAVVVLLGLGQAGQSQAQSVDAKALPPSIRVSADAVITAEPDKAVVQVGVMTQAPTAESAGAQNAERVDAVLKELRQILARDAELRTVQYSVNPVYRYPREGGSPTITAYSANNTVEVTTRDLTQVGKIIDTATRAGANNIQRLHFTLQDEQEPQGRALREATLKAKAKAETVASALGVRVIRLLHAEEGGGMVQPVREFGLAMARTAEAGAPTPVEPGTIEVRANVTLTFEVAP